MNKKLLFAAMSLVALTACNSDDFENQQVAEQAVSPVQFEVINNDALTRASMTGTDKNTIEWSVKDGDLFTLYHGALALGNVSGYENATYKSTPVEGKPATLTTPTMIKEGAAIMVWPVDSEFNIKPATDLFIKIPAKQTEKIQNEIPYVSDQIEIGAYTKWDAEVPATYTNTAGLNRKYPVYMRPMASQLNVVADYSGTDETIAELYENKPGVEKGEGITEIKVTSIDLLTSNQFTTKIGLKFNDPTPAQTAKWNAKVPGNAWGKVTAFDMTKIDEQADKLSTKFLNDNKGCKFLILPQENISSVDGAANAGVVVNTIYGKVLVAKKGEVAGSKYEDSEIKDAWWRYITTGATITGETKGPKITSGEFKDKYKTTANIAVGMKQTLNTFSTYTMTTKDNSSIVEGEPIGGALKRYVKVLLSHLDMSDLHVKDDKQLRDVVRVWKKLGLDPVTVYVDGGQGDDAAEQFTISQKTIQVINELNTDVNGDKQPDFKIMPCNEAGEECTSIIVTGGGDIQDVAFIAKNGSTKANVVFKAGETWTWKVDAETKVAAVKVDDDGVKQFINEGTMTNNATATLKTIENDGTQNNVQLINKGTWTVAKPAILNVQFSVINRKNLNIAKGAQYRQDGLGHNFKNDADLLPTRFGGNDEVIGTIENKGVFAAVNNGNIFNYGLIEHADVDAKTYITTNELGGDFTTAFTASNLIGRINLPYSNKEEDNISISAAADKGFVSVTVSAKDAPADGKLNTAVVGERVNYVIVNAGINTIEALPAQIKYVEINEPGTEIAWSLTAPATYTGLILLSDVNIKLNTQITATTTYLGKSATMYVGGKFNKAGTDWNGYYGDTEANVATNYVYFGD
jgi:hypothetical protein